MADDDYTYEQYFDLVRGTLEAAIDAELRILGYGKAIDGTYENTNGIHIAPPQYGGYSGDSGDNGETIARPGFPLINVYQDIFLKWKVRVEALFAPYFNLPDPAGFDAIAEDMRRGISQLATQGKEGSKGGARIDYASNTTLGEAHDIAGTLAVWQGAASQSFKSYLNLFYEVVGNQALAADAIRACIYMEKELWKNTRADAASLAGNAKDAFEAVGRDGGDFAALLSLLGTVSTVLGWFPGFSVITAPITNSLDKVTSVGGVFVDTFGAGETATSSNPLGGGGVEDVWGRVEKASKDLQEKLRTVEQDIADSLDNIHDQLTAVGRRPDGRKDDQSFVLARPKGILEADERSDIVSDKAQMIVEPRTIKTAGHQLVHNLAPEIKVAGRALEPSGDTGAWTRDGSLGISATGPMSNYRTAAGFLAHEVAQTAVELEYAGETLQAVGDNFAKGDDAVAGGLAKLHKRLHDGAGS